jgi:hypothetical protein
MFGFPVFSPGFQQARMRTFLLLLNIGRLRDLRAGLGPGVQPVG